MLEIRCFDGFRVAVDKRPLTQFYSQKARALLIYLAVEAGRAQSRSYLAGLLWPDYPEARARRNLSQTLTALRKDLGTAASFVQSNNQTISLSNSPELIVDVTRFAAGITAVRQHSHANLLTCPTCTETLQETANLYTGPFLDQFNIGDSPLFENWIIAERERQQQQAIDLFSRLSNVYAAQGRRETALLVVQRLLELAPWQESAHRQRMLLLAQQGQRIQALAQYDILCDVLMGELGVSPGVETDELYDQILAGEIEVEETKVETVETQATKTNTPFYAPAVSPYFVGREAELNQIRRLLDNRHKLASDDQATSQIALVGMGGVGKTAFAAHTAQQLKPHFADGVLWGNSRTSDVHNILNLWAQAYGNDFSGMSDLDSKAMAVREMLTHKETLVIIDNVDDAALARPLLPNCSRCMVLLTTRNLDIAASLDAQPIPLTELEPDLSQQLLLRILGEERILHSEEEAKAATKIGNLLHHLPLAIEIAAKRLLSRPRMRLAALALRLENTQQRLGLAISDQAVRTSFQVSWEGLTRLSRRLFAAIGIFAGRPFTPEALAAIADLDLFDTEDELYTLAALSLVNEEGDVRYRQHLLLADFAQEKLGEEAKDVNGRFATYYLTFAQAHATNLEALEPEWDNLSAAVQAAYDLQQWQTVLDFTDALAEAWFKYGRFHDANKLYALAKTAAEALPSNEQLAQTLLRWAEVEIEQSNYQPAWERLETILPIYYQLEDESRIARVRYFQGYIHFDQGEYAKAEACIRESQALYAEQNDVIAETKSIDLLARIYFETEDTPDRAEQTARQAMQKLARWPDSPNLISLWKLLGTIEIRKRDLDAAQSYLQRALNLSESLHIPLEAGAAKHLLALVHRLRANHGEAEKTAKESLAILRHLGSKRYEAMVLHELSTLYLHTNRYDQAKDLTEKNLVIYRQIEDRLGYAYALRLLGDIYVKINQNESGQAAWEEALQVARFLNNQHLIKQLNARLAPSD